MSHDLLFEIGTEELPTKAVSTLGQALLNNITLLLKKANLSHKETKWFATPRRLAIIINDLDPQQPQQEINKRGPKFNHDDTKNPSAALLGFAKSCGVELKQLTIVPTDKGEYWNYSGVKAGAATSELLPIIIQEALTNLPIAKPMRWGEGDYSFARPVHWCLFLYDGQILDTNIFGIKANDKTYGHRFLAPHEESVTSKTYESKLEKAYVIADFDKRKSKIKEEIIALAKKNNFLPILSEDLLDEVTAIVEWPLALLASYSPNFLELPQEVIIASLQNHQKCFALTDITGKLVPHFITISNIASKDEQQVIAGNEKVVNARLSDAVFFFTQDKKQSLVERFNLTKNVVFQAKLGSLQDKIHRLQKIMENLAAPLNLNIDEAKRAALLSKCDLLTSMVIEFPELQGLMGYYYAKHDDEPKNVAQALDEQYMPRFAADKLPESKLGMALSLADRIDTLVGFFAIGQKPSGEKDPFKLRRHALAVARILIATPENIELTKLLQFVANNLPLDQKNSQSPQLSSQPHEIKTFILERLPAYYAPLGISNEVIKGVTAKQDEWFFDLDRRIQALQQFKDDPNLENLSAACKRVNNILNQAKFSGNDEIDNNLLTEVAEKELFAKVQACETITGNLYSQGKYQEILTHLADLRDVVDNFFDKVMVMAEDSRIKENRLKLLKRLQNLLKLVADISL